MVEASWPRSKESVGCGYEEGMMLELLVRRCESKLNARE